MKKIGYVLKVFPRLSQTFIVNEIQAHEKTGCDIVVFSLRRPKPEDKILVKHQLNSPIVYLSGTENDWPNELAMQVRRHGIEHLHAYFGNVAARTARLAAKKAQIPYTFTAHALDIFDDKVDQAELKKNICDSAGVVTVSKFNVRYLRKIFGRRPILVYNGMPLTSTDKPSSTAPLARYVNVFKPGKEPTILAVGRFVEKKGFDILIGACHVLMSRGIQFRCKIVGSGNLEEDFRSQISRLRLDARVELLGAMPPQAVSQSDTIQLADACQELMEDSGLANKLASNARGLIEENFDSQRTSAKLRSVWNRPQRRTVFRIHNRRGLGHWMRSLNIATEILRLEPDTDVLFYTRSAPPFQMDKAIRCEVAADPEDLSLLPIIRDFSPHVVIDDTILKAIDDSVSHKHILIMRKLADEKQLELFNSDLIRSMKLIIVPHTPDEFGQQIPKCLEERMLFVGPIIRQANESTISAMRRKFELRSNDFVLVSTPGGGGFKEDSERFFKVVQELHRKISIPNLRHILIRGPNASTSVTAVDDRMTVVDSEPDLVGLFILANVVVSAGGYNSVNEIRSAKCPASFCRGNASTTIRRNGWPGWNDVVSLGFLRGMNRSLSLRILPTS